MERGGCFPVIAATHVGWEECIWGLCIKKQLAYVLRETSACGGLNCIQN